MECNETTAQVQACIREHPAQAAWVSVGVGLLLAQLPLRLLATALARLGVWMLKPALILYGLYRLAEDCHARRCPGDEAK